MFEVNEKNNVALDSEHYDGETLKDVYGAAYRPEGMTLFESDRIRIIPFNRHFEENERDIDLKSFFAKPENLSGILNWCLEGFRLYQKEGLKMPESVASATQEYRDRSDRISMFTKQCLER